MEQKGIWDEMYRHLEWKRETMTLPKILKNKKVLELGVGNGKTLASILKQKPSQVCAIDFSKRAIEKYKENFKDRADFLIADARKLPFDKESFDIVVVYYVLNNSIKKDRIKIVKEIHRVLKKNSICIFEDFSINDFRNKGYRNTMVKKNGLICHFFDERELRVLFKDFSKIKVETRNFYPVKNKKNLKREIINVLARKVQRSR